MELADWAASSALKGEFAIVVDPVRDRRGTEEADEPQSV